MAKSLSGEIAGRIPWQAERFGDRRPKKRIAKRVQHQRQRALGDVMLVVPDRELRDEASDRIEDRIERVPVPGEDHPCGQRSGALLAERVETLVDNDARVGLSGARTFNRIGDAAVDRVGDGFRKRALETSSRPEMVEKIGVSPANFAGDSLQGYGLWTLLEKQLARSSKCGRTAFFRAEACSSY